MSNRSAARAGQVALVIAFMFFATPLALVGQRATVSGTVVSADGGEPLAGASVRVVNAGLHTLSNAAGRFSIAGLRSGAHRLEVALVGYTPVMQSVDLRSGAAVDVSIRMIARPIELDGIDVSVLRPTLERQGELTQAQVRAANPRDVGDVLRALSGVDAVRRGPLGLDPVVRGLRESEIGNYLDGARMFPAGPQRMDSPFTHLDPSAISKVEVVKGPYALTWGGGNLSAIRVETDALPPTGSEGFSADLSSGFDTNVEAAEGFGSFRGRRGRVSVWGHGAWRSGSDYEDGNGTLVQGDYDSWEGRGKLGVDLSADTRLTVGGGYQDQGRIDYPGRVLNAEFFETVNTSLALEHHPTDGPVRAFDFNFYYSRTEHGMDNSGKPTRAPDPDRTPPFALDIGVDSEIEVFGGRGALAMDMGAGIELLLGGDAYLTRRDAVRTIEGLDDGTNLFTDELWPGARLENGGAFVQLSGRSGRATWSATARGDFIKANTDTIGDFFAENVSTSTEAAETEFSGALTIGLQLTTNWTASLGVGSAVRPADVLERYSDRIPASKSQISAEFMGNPALQPERSNQADLWLEASYPRVHANVNAFARRIDDYITIEPTELEKRLPLSPPTVYRYVNGEAEFWGVEGSVSVAASDEVTVQATGSYLWSRDNELDEPGFGISPVRGKVTARYTDPASRFYVEGVATAVGEQTRVSTSRGETPTEGYVIGDVRASYNLYEGVNLTGGVLNVLDEFYVNHLNAMNPFSGQRVAEPGRVIFVDLSYSFRSF